MAKQFTPEDVLDTLGYDNVVSLGERIGNRYFKADAVKKHILEKLSVAHYLKLHETKGKTLIDIGTGAGWFPYICKLYGHTCIGTDELNRDNYQPIYDWLELDIRDELVCPHTPFGLTEKVDYVVTLRSFFPNRPNVWEMEEWKYFFNDIIKNINPNGGLYLGSNSGDRRGRFKELPDKQKSHWGPLEVGDMFKQYLVPPNKALKIKPNTVYLPYNVVKKLGEAL